MYYVQVLGNRSEQYRVSKLLRQTFDRSVCRKNGREIKRQQIRKHIHHCLLKSDARLDATKIQTVELIVDYVSIVYRFYQNSELAETPERRTVKRAAVVYKLLYRVTDQRCRYLCHDLFPFNSHSSHVC